MNRLIVAFVALVVLAGCRAPMPSFDPLAPYGSTRVPAPGTGSYGSPDTYYQGPEATTPVGSGFRARTSATENESGVQLASHTEDNASQVGSGVKQASLETARLVPSGSVTESPIRIVEPAPSESGTRPKLNGMRVKDATRPAEPAAFNPPEEVIDISQLPKPSASTANSRVVVSESVATGSSSSSGSSGTIGWQSRYVPNLRVANR